MTVIGIDDTDSRERGMCTTYVAARVADALRAEGAVTRLLLVRLNPAVEHKTRGNAALAVHTDVDADSAFAVAREAVDDAAEVADPNTNPGLVVAPGDPAAVPPAVARFAGDALVDHLTRERAREAIDAAGFRREAWGNGRGLVGALAAVGAWRARGPADAGDWTWEVISYRERDRWGAPREFAADSAFRAAETPGVWDTVDRGSGEVVCVPRTPGPVLHGVRGDDRDACLAVADAVEAEPVAARETFLTNQGTDDHLRDGAVADARDGRAYRLTGTVAGAPETRRGGHVFVPLADGDAALQCAAFEPTKRFRDRVRALREGDRVTVCGEFAARAPDEGGPTAATAEGADAPAADRGVGRGTLKLEKFAVRDLVDAERVTPTCGDCGRRMKSAGRDQGYRCRDCDTRAPGKVERPVERDLELGWYEVPPRARRHVAKPLVRGGFDAPTYPER